MCERFIFGHIQSPNQQNQPTLPPPHLPKVRRFHAFSSHLPKVRKGTTSPRAACSRIFQHPTPCPPSEGESFPRIFVPPSEGAQRHHLPESRLQPHFPTPHTMPTFQRCAVSPHFRPTFRRCAETPPPREPPAAAFFLPPLLTHLPKVSRFTAFSSHLPKVSHFPAFSSHLSLLRKEWRKRAVCLLLPKGLRRSGCQGMAQDGATAARG